jgi:signal transduction histidine kinase
VKSLRTRFFLISWPLVVIAVVAVAIGVDRWTVVELERTQTEPVKTVDQARSDDWADSLAASWQSLRSGAGPALLSGLAKSATPPVEILVVDTTRVVLATTDSTLRIAAGNGATLRIIRSTSERGFSTESEFVLRGIPIRDARGARLGELLIVPVAGKAADFQEESLAVRRTTLRRRIWGAVLVASIVSAAATLILAGPLVGQIRLLNAGAVALRNGDLKSRIVATGTDELGELGKSFNAMAEALDQADAHKRRLITDVAHELRTPLTNIIGIIEAIQDGLRKPDAAVLASLRDEAGLLATLIAELQELSLAESGQLTYRIEDIDAVAIATAAVDAMRESGRGILLHGPTNTDPVMVRADAQRLAQILRNLLRNSVTHTPANGRISVTVTSGEGRVSISVADSGSGIPADQLTRIWERFHRVDPSRDRASGGMGLGLALVKELVEGMGGTVGVTSKVGSGSIFRVELPASESENADLT